MRSFLAIAIACGFLWAASGNLLDKIGEEKMTSALKSEGIVLGSVHFISGVDLAHSKGEDLFVGSDPNSFKLALWDLSDKADEAVKKKKYLKFSTYLLTKKRVFYCTGEKAPIEEEINVECRERPAKESDFSIAELFLKSRF
jgi:hypothetical protein